MRLIAEFAVTHQEIVEKEPKYTCYPDCDQRGISEAPVIRRQAQTALRQCALVRAVAVAVLSSHAARASSRQPSRAWTRACASKCVSVAAAVSASASSATLVSASASMQLVAATLT